jgi:HrpA-like RNA helicase
MQSLENRLRLPIANRAGEIVTAIQGHQVVVIKGNTGCGKTTQVPQFILDNMIANQSGAECNIVVTQVGIVTYGTYMYNM